jgi:hypothetical protein
MNELLLLIIDQKELEDKIRLVVEFGACNQ